MWKNVNVFGRQPFCFDSLDVILYAKYFIFFVIISGRYEQCCSVLRGRWELWILFVEERLSEEIDVIQGIRAGRWEDMFEMDAEYTTRFQQYCLDLGMFLEYFIKRKWIFVVSAYPCDHNNMIRLFLNLYSPSSSGMPLSINYNIETSKYVQ